VNRSLPLARLAAAGALASLPLAVPLLATTGPWAETPEARVRLVSGWASAPAVGAESDLDLGVELVLAPGWHVYWKNSGDAGYAPKLDLAATPAIAGAALLFPAPHRFDLPGGLVSFGYENEVIYPVTGRVLRTTPEPFVLRGRLDYLICATECVPYTADLRLDLPDATAAGGGTDAGADAARLERWRRRLPLAAASSAANQAGAPSVATRIERDKPAFSTLELAVSGGDFRATAPDIFFESHPLLALGKPALSIGESGLTFRVPVRPLDETKPLPPAIDLAWTLTGLEGSAGAYALEGRSKVAYPSAVASNRYFWLAALGLVPIAWLASRFRPRRTALPNT
jgi:DsbC/DsbD-like thiol-disulfide interchange protein